MNSFGRSVVVSLVYWLPLATLTVLLSGLVYVTVQQQYRTSANDPQIQMASDARTALLAGATPQSLVPTTTLDIATSYAPYLAIFDANGQQLASSATLHGAALPVPRGVFQAATPMNAVSWMPESGVRSALVVVSYPNGYVVAGRSLALVEDREGNLTRMVTLACVATLALTYLAVLATRLIAPRLERA